MKHSTRSMILAFAAGLQAMNYARGGVLPVVTVITGAVNFGFLAWSIYADTKATP